MTIELEAKTEASEISWSFIGTNCQSLPSLSVSANRIYKRNCGLAVGHSYILQCEGSWQYNYLVVENMKYCEYTSSNTTVNVTITGELENFEHI